MYKKILVPLDGSKRAEEILPHVESLAANYGATVLLLLVVEPMMQITTSVGDYSRLEPELLKQQVQNAEKYLAVRQGKLRYKDVESRALVSQGPIVEEIINVAEREGVDLVAMVSHGRTGLARVFYGSVAAGVLHRIDRPLLLIRSMEQGS